MPVETCNRFALCMIAKFHCLRATNVLKFPLIVLKEICNDRTSGMEGLSIIIEKSNVYGSLEKSTEKEKMVIRSLAEAGKVVYLFILHMYPTGVCHQQFVYSCFLTAFQ